MSEKEKDMLLKRLIKWMEEITITADNVPNWRAVKSALATIIIILTENGCSKNDKLPD